MFKAVECFLTQATQKMYNPFEILRFAGCNILGWNRGKSIEVFWTCGEKTMPRLQTRMHEFVPNNKLQNQLQYSNGQQKKKWSAPLAFLHLHVDDVIEYDAYINEIVDHNIHAFVELHCEEDDDDFQKRLFRLMIQVKLYSKSEHKLRREVLRLIVATYIMGHTFTIAGETEAKTLSQMRSSPDTKDKYISSRLGNRQLKYYFNHLQGKIWQTVLAKLEGFFESKDSGEKWLALLVAILGMCIACEEQQKTIRVVMATRVAEGLDQTIAQQVGNTACQTISDSIALVKRTFHLKYNVPVSSHNQAQAVCQIFDLVKEKCKLSLLYAFSHYDKAKTFSSISPRKTNCEHHG